MKVIFNTVKILLQTINISTNNSDDITVVEFDGLSGSSITLRTIRYKDFKYGHNCGFEDEFYDLAKDPFEMKNLINDPGYRDTIQYLRGRPAQWMTQTNDMAGVDPRVGPCNN